MKIEYKKKAILDRIKRIEKDLLQAREYLEDGANAHWHKFKPMFNGKIVDGESAPPHKSWVRNVFLPRREKALRESENLIEQFENRK